MDALTTLAPSTTLVALTPAELPAVQSQLTSWCQLKMRELGQAYRELSENLRLAKKHRWRTVPLRNAVARTKKQIQYYQKIKIATQAGYLIVPNFEAEIMAVRVDRHAPRPVSSTWNRNPAIIQAKAGLLPVNTGRYVGAQHKIVDESFLDKDPKNPGKMKNVPRFEASEYQDVEFPVVAVKPVILDAAQRAMSLHVFDRIGVVTGRKKDPVVIGEILNPTDRWQNRRVTFFIAWWLDTDSL